MKPFPKILTTGALAAGLLVPLSMTTASPAYADRCEPTEPVVRVLMPQYEEFMAEQDSPFCYVMLNYVYPRICDDYTTLLGTCINSLNPDFQEPITVYPYQPDAGRIYCNTYLAIVRALNSTGSCTYAPVAVGAE